MHPSRRALIHLLLSLSLLAGTMFGTPPAPAAAQDAPVSSAGEGPSGDSEVVELRTRYSKTYRNSDGTLTQEVRLDPLHYRRDGDWQEIDTTLVPDPAGGWRNAAGSLQVSFAPTSGADNLMSIAAGPGAGLDLAAPAGFRDRPATVEGDTITYPGVLGGVDLVFVVRPSGVEQFFRLNSAPSGPLSFRLPLSLRGLNPEDRGDHLVFRDSSGEIVLSVPQAFMHEAGPGGDSAPVQVSFDGSGPRPVLEVRPDQAWLADSRRVYPVMIDPSFTQMDFNDTYVEKGNEFSHAADTELRMGQNPDTIGTKGPAWALMHFEIGQAAGTHVLSATFKTYAFYAATCTAKEAKVYRITSDWNAIDVRWPTRPSIAPTMLSSMTKSVCPSAWLDSFDVTDTVAGWVEGRYANHGLTVRAADETNGTFYKKLASRHYSNDTYDPRLFITYNSYPGAVTSLTPSSGSTVDLAPTLSGIYNDPDAGDAGHVRFEIYRATDSVPSNETRTCPTAAIRCGISDAQGNPGARLSWSLTSPLAAGSYKWRARGDDGVDLGPWIATPYPTFSAADLTAPAAPTVSSSTHPNESTWYAHDDPSLSWTTPSDPSGISGYAHSLTLGSVGNPGTTVTTTANSASYSNLQDGTWYFNIRARDGAGNWSVTVSRALRVDDTAPFMPSLSSSTHPSETTWYSNNSPRFTWSASDTSGINGYSYTLDQLTGSVPDQISDTSASEYSYSGLSDGIYYFHLRARNGSNLWSTDTAHRRVQIDVSAPAVPALSSSTHPDPTQTYRSNDPAFTWSAPSDLSGVTGYSYVLDQVSTTTPDAGVDATSTSKSYVDVADGTYWFHVRAKDAAGNWGSASHLKVNIDTPAPHIVPVLTAPSGQVSPDGYGVVDDGDRVFISGQTTEGSDPGAPLDGSAVISACDLVVFDDTGAQTSRKSVPLTDCRNVDGQLTGSFAPTSYGVTTGGVHLEVVAERTSSGVTETSGAQSSDVVLVDNVDPRLTYASFGCDSDLVATCSDNTTVALEFSKAVRGDLSLADFSVDGAIVTAVTSQCNPAVWCDEAILTLAAPTLSSSPRATYSFNGVAGEQPRDGLGQLLAASSTGIEPPPTAPDLDAEPIFYADDATEPAVDVPASPDGSILVLDDNVFQSYAKVEESCPPKFADGDSTTKEEKKCDPAGRERRLAKRIVALAAKDTDDGMAAAPDLLLFQETRSIDARGIVGHLNRLMKLDGKSCNIDGDLCYRLVISSREVKIRDTKNARVINDTAIVRNRRTMALNDRGAFVTTYTRAESCKPTRNKRTGELIEIDVDLDDANDCDPDKRKYKQHYMAAFTKKGTTLTAAVASILWVTSSHLADDKEDAVWTRWAAKSADKVAQFATESFGAGGPSLQVLAGDFNTRRCELKGWPEYQTCDDPATPTIETPKRWWSKLTQATLMMGREYNDAVLAANPTDAHMEQQYENGTREAKHGRRIDFLFARSATAVTPGAASKNHSCGESQTQLEELQRTCAFLSNSERYSDHLLIWGLLKE